MPSLLKIITVQKYSKSSVKDSFVEILCFVLPWKINELQVQVCNIERIHYHRQLIASLIKVGINIKNSRCVLNIVWIDRRVGFHCYTGQVRSEWSQNLQSLYWRHLNVILDMGTIEKKSKLCTTGRLCWKFPDKRLEAMQYNECMMMFILFVQKDAHLSLT